MIFINLQLKQFKVGDVWQVELMAQAYPLLYEEVEEKFFPSGYRKGWRKVRDIAIRFDDSGENVIVQTDLTNAEVVKAEVEEFIQKNIIRYEAEKKRAERYLKTLYDAIGEGEQMNHGQEETKQYAEIMESAFGMGGQQ